MTPTQTLTWSKWKLLKFNSITLTNTCNIHIIGFYSSYNNFRFKQGRAQQPQTRCTCLSDMMPQTCRPPLHTTKWACHGPIWNNLRTIRSLIGCGAGILSEAKTCRLVCLYLCSTEGAKDRFVQEATPYVRICLHVPSLQAKQSWPRASTLPQQMRSCVRQTEAPILNPTAM